MKKLFIMSLIVMTSACSSLSEKVIARSDGLSSRPDWAKETVSYFEKDGMSNFVGTQVIDGAMNTTWVCTAAANMAKKEVSDTVKQKLDFIVQGANEDMSVGMAQLKYVGTEASNISLSNLRKDGCYWEKVVTQASVDDKQVLYRAFVKTSMPTQQLKDAIKKAGMKRGLSKEFQKQVDERWEVTTKAEE